ncbi:MAG: preprotein translocase subunit SecE [Candidatus Acidiferrales bacterium]
MAQAAKLNKEEANGGPSFSVPEPVGKIVSYPRRLRTFLHEVKVEMKQVNWPSRHEVWSTTIVVTVTVAFFGLFFFSTDAVFGHAAKWVLSYFGSH